MGRFRELLSVAGVAAIVVLIGAAIATLDPMGLDDAADRHSAAIVARMTAPFYGGDILDPSKPPAARDRITVIEVSDETLRQTGVSWPAPRAFYTQLLDILAPADGPQPAAIFLDYILLSDLRDEANHDRFLAKVGAITQAAGWEERLECRTTAAAKIDCILKAGGTPVIVGKPYPPDLCLGGQGDDISALARLDQVAVVVPLGWPGAPESAVPVFRQEAYAAQIGANPEGRGVYEKCRILHPVTPDDFDAAEQLRRHPSTSGKALRWPGPGPYDLSPAAAMLVSLCRREQRAGGDVTLTCAAMIDKGGAVVWSKPSTMSVAWGAKAPARFLDLRSDVYTNADDRDERCRAETRWRVLELGWRQLSSAIGQNSAGARVPCPYHATFDYALIRGEVGGATDLGEKIRRDYLDGRVILVGAAMIASTDWIDSVVHGRLAGVHYHAMMLDNLVEKGRRVLRSPPEVFAAGPLADLNLDWGEMLEFAAAFLVVIVVELGRRRLATRDTPDGRGFVWIAIVFGWAILVLAAASAITILMHWKPVNIVGLFGLTVMDAIASFWSVEGAAWVVSLGWVGARTRGRRAIHALAQVVFRLASAAGILFTSFRRRPRSPQPEDGSTATVPRPEESSRHD